MYVAAMAGRDKGRKRSATAAKAHILFIAREAGLESLRVHLESDVAKTAHDMLKLSFLVKSDADIDLADYDRRTIGHLAAAEGHMEMLHYLATKSNFDFNLADRWNNQVLDELKDEEAKR